MQKNNLIFVQSGNSRLREYYIQLLNKECVSARAVEKAAEYLDSVIEESVVQESSVPEIKSYYTSFLVLCTFNL